MTALFSEMRYGHGEFGEYRSLPEAYAIVLEEVDELWAEVKVNDRVRCAEEALQVAATAYRLYLELTTPGAHPLAPHPSDKLASPEPGQ